MCIILILHFIFSLNFFTFLKILLRFLIKKFYHLDRKIAKFFRARFKEKHKFEIAENPVKSSLYEKNTLVSFANALINSTCKNAK